MYFIVFTPVIALILSPFPFSYLLSFKGKKNQVRVRRLAVAFDVRRAALPRADVRRNKARADLLLALCAASSVIPWMKKPTAFNWGAVT